MVVIHGLSPWDLFLALPTVERGHLSISNRSGGLTKMPDSVFFPGYKVSSGHEEGCGAPYSLHGKRKRRN